MKEAPDILKILEKDIKIPERVNEKAEEAFRKIYAECEDKGKTANDVIIRSDGKRRKRTAVYIAAAVIAVSAVTAVAAVLKWSESLSDGLQASEEQMKEMENSGMNTFVGQSCEDNGVTITAVQSITDNYYTYLAFKIDGYEIGGGEEPAIENVDVTVDGEDNFSWNAGFWDGTVSNNEGEPVTVDGERLKIDENGRVIMNYVMDDGSMEYRMILFNNEERGYFLNKPIHVEIENLGTSQKADYIPGIEGRWSFDWTLGGADDTLVFEPDMPLGDSGATVKQMEISPLSIMTVYDFPRREVVEEGFDENGKPGTLTRYAEPPEAKGVRLKDGTVIKYLYGGPGGGGYEEEDSDIYLSLLNADRVIYPEEIESVLFLKPYDEYGDGLTENDFYEVHLNDMK